MSAKLPRSRQVLNSAIAAQSIPQLTSVLEIARSDPRTTYSDFLTQALIHTCRKNSPNFAIHLINHENAPVAALDPRTVSFACSISVLECLESHGWDIDQQGRHDVGSKGKRILHYVLKDPEIVKWLLDRGVTLDGEPIHDPTKMVSFPPPVLQTCASSGCVESAALLRSKGAVWGRLSLHLAVEGAAQYGVDPGQESLEADDEGAAERKRTDKILRYVVEHENLDLNALYTGANAIMLWGTPLNYAAKESKGAKVVAWLLAKGADPEIETSYGTALHTARASKCVEVVEVIESWIASSARK